MRGTYNHQKRLKKRVAGGFSLIELVVVLGLISTVVGVALVASFRDDSEKRLRSATNAVETMMRRARSLAMVQQTVYLVTFQEGAVVLGSSKILEEQKEEPRPGFLRETEQDIEDQNAVAEFQPVSDSDGWDSELTVEVRRWGSKKWSLLDEHTKHTLRFDPTGVSEPISLRVTFEGSVIEQEYHPLTASVRNETSEIR